MLDAPAVEFGPSSNLDSFLRKQLAPGETLLWSQAALPDGLARRVGGVTKFGYAFAGFAAVWMFVAATIIIVGSLAGSPSQATSPASSASTSSSSQSQASPDWTLHTSPSSPASPYPSTATLAPSQPPVTSPQSSGSSQGVPIADVPLALRIGFPLFGLFFLLPGLWFARAGARARRLPALYGITPLRVLVVSINKRGERTTCEYGPHEIRPITMRERPDGSGDLVFESVHRAGDSTVRVNGKPIPIHGLWGVVNVQDVRRRVEAILPR